MSLGKKVNYGVLVYYTHLGMRIRKNSASYKQMITIYIYIYIYIYLCVSVIGKKIKNIQLILIMTNPRCKGNFSEWYKSKIFLKKFYFKN